MCRFKSLISSEAGESLSSLTLHLTELLKRDVVIAYVAISSSEMLQTMGRLASSIKYRRPVKLLRKSVGLKYNEQILVLSVI